MAHMQYPGVFSFLLLRRNEVKLHERTGRTKRHSSNENMIWTAAFNISTLYLNYKCVSIRCSVGPTHDRDDGMLDQRNIGWKHSTPCEPRHEKTCFNHMRITKVQMNLRASAQSDQHLCCSQLR